MAWHSFISSKKERSRRKKNLDENLESMKEKDDYE